VVVLRIVIRKIYIYTTITNVCDEAPAQLQEYPLRQEHPPWRHLAETLRASAKNKSLQKCILIISQ
jgi:hypothetical protein